MNAVLGLSVSSLALFVLFDVYLFQGPLAENIPMDIMTNKQQQHKLYTSVQKFWVTWKCPYFLKKGNVLETADFLLNIYIGVQRPISNNHHDIV